MVGPIAGLTILCIDNKSSVLNGVETLLSGWGRKVLRAANALEAGTLIGVSADVPDIIRFHSPSKRRAAGGSSTALRRRDFWRHMLDVLHLLLSIIKTKAPGARASSIKCLASN
jgi:hypothetical protein